MGVEASKIRIGLMGGSFNPIHHGHLVLAECARIQFSLEKVIFIPTGKPGHKVKEMPISPDHRHNMTLLATESNPYFFISRIELDREDPCYTVDTLTFFAETFPKLRFELYFITGADSVLDILTWKNPQEALSLANFIAGTRPGYSFSDFFNKLSNLPSAQEQIHLIEIPSLDISSSQIRANIRAGKSIRYLVPNEVEFYINKHKLYA